MELPKCGLGMDGFGCGKPIGTIGELYRCADCNVPMHQHCLIHHFGDGKSRETKNYGRVTAPYKHVHEFGVQMAYLVSEILKRDNLIKKLTNQQITRIENYDEI